MKNINATNKKVCVEVVGYLLEELRDAGNFENFKKDVGKANIFIGSLIFIEELAEKVCAPSEETYLCSYVQDVDRMHLRPSYILRSHIKMAHALGCGG